VSNQKLTYFRLFARETLGGPSSAFGLMLNGESLARRSARSANRPTHGQGKVPWHQRAVHGKTLNPSMGAPTPLIDGLGMGISSPLIW